jgi:hypothetical protein
MCERHRASTQEYQENDNLPDAPEEQFQVSILQPHYRSQCAARIDARYGITLCAEPDGTNERRIPAILDLHNRVARRQPYSTSPSVVDLVRAAIPS